MKNSTPTIVIQSLNFRKSVLQLICIQIPGAIRERLKPGVGARERGERPAWRLGSSPKWIRSRRIRLRLGIACLVGLAAALLCFYFQSHYFTYLQAGDLTWPLQAARLWRSGVDPYTVTMPYGGSRMYYPFTAVLLALPFSFLPNYLASTVFIGLSIGLMTFAVLKDGYWRLVMLASLPVLAVVTQVQWNAWLVVLWYYPLLMPFALAKPTGLAASARSLTWKSLALAAAFGLLSLALFPGWPLSLLSIAGSATASIPLFYPAGFLVLLALPFWRKPEARLLLLLAVTPQHMFFYDQLPILLVARSLRQQIFLGFASLLALFMALAAPTHTEPAGGWIVFLFYGAAVAVFLYNQREEVAAFIHRFTLLTPIHKIYG